MHKVSFQELEVALLACSSPDGGHFPDEIKAKVGGDSPYTVLAMDK